MSLVTILVSLSFAAEPICARNYQELVRTENLKQLTNYLPDQGHRGFVNETQGSYFYIQSFPDYFRITFLTTGIFDLYGIRRDGEVRFCDMNGKLYIFGLGMEEVLTFYPTGIQLGDAQPRKRFSPGRVPAQLYEKHNLSEFEKSF